MSCLYVVWDVIDDTIARKVNASDASAFAHVCGCCPSQGNELSLVYFLSNSDLSLVDSLGCPLARYRHNLLRSRNPSWSRSLQRICPTAKGRCIPFPASARFKIRSCLDGYTKRIRDVDCARTVSIPRIVGVPVARAWTVVLVFSLDDTVYLVF